MEGEPMSPAADDNRDTDLRSRVVALEHADAALTNRLNNLEQWQMQARIDEARKEGKWANVDKRFDDLEKKIEKISGILSKIMWLFISGLVLAFVAFVANGGLRVP
jgi:predicted nuclease with TOPRIM domain